MCLKKKFPFSTGIEIFFIMLDMCGIIYEIPRNHDLFLLIHFFCPCIVPKIHRPPPPTSHEFLVPIILSFFFAGEFLRPLKEHLRSMTQSATELSQEYRM
jgi:hypothetical protein